MARGPGLGGAGGGRSLTGQSGAAELKWLVLLTGSCVLSIILFLTATLSISRRDGAYYKGSLDASVRVAFTNPSLPVLAYAISGARGDGERMKRLMLALFHPRNEYLLHLELDAPPQERMELGRFLRTQPHFADFGNVHMVAKANMVTYRGPTMVSTTLHAAAILLRLRSDWDWFINLSASDYPIMTQDDILHSLAPVPRHLNFIEHTSNLGWKEDFRAKPIIVDPGIHLTRKGDIFFASQRRPMPTSFKLFTGSAWVMLSRAFIEYCVWGWDNLPRLMLMYYTNFLSSPEGYFHTVICNAKEFRNTTINHDLHFIQWDWPPKQHPRTINETHFANMSTIGVPFARKFAHNGPVLTMIDEQILNRAPGKVTPGGWCKGRKDDDDPCVHRGDPNNLIPGPNARNFRDLLDRLTSEPRLSSRQCQ